VDIKQELEKLDKEIAKLPPISKKAEMRINQLADLLADAFLERYNSGTLPKHEKREK
jgi:hypothetical protein